MTQILITSDARLAIDRYTAVKVEAVTNDDLTQKLREDARCYAVEALVAILNANPQAFDYVARMADVAAAKGRR